MLKSKGYNSWIFKGVELGDWYIGVQAPRSKLWAICIQYGVKRKVLGLSVRRRVGGWVKNEGMDHFWLKNQHRGQKGQELHSEWEDYGYECYENEINGTKFEPFTFRERQELIYYDINNILDIDTLI